MAQKRLRVLDRFAGIEILVVDMRQLMLVGLELFLGGQPR